MNNENIVQVTGHGETDVGNLGPPSTVLVTSMERLDNTCHSVRQQAANFFYGEFTHGLKSDKSSIGLAYCLYTAGIYNWGIVTKNHYRGQRNLGSLAQVKKLPMTLPTQL